MMLSQKFKTSDGASKRASFENMHLTEHSKRHGYIYIPVRFLDGKRDTADFEAAAFKARRYHWQLEKRKRAKDC